MSFFDRCLRSRETGRITIAQLPNVPLWIFLATVALRVVVAGGSGLRTAIDWIGIVALAWWAVDELFRGVNLWRRALGLAGCGFVVAGLFAMIG